MDNLKHFDNYGYRIIIYSCLGFHSLYFDGKVIEKEIKSQVRSGQSV